VLNYNRTHLLHIAVLSAVYFLAAKLGLALALVYNTVTLFWPPSGIALAALLVFGWRVFPAIAIGEFFASLSMGLPLSSLAGMSCGNALEGLVGYYLLRHCFGFGEGLHTLRDVALLFVFGALISPLVAAVNGAWWIKHAIGGSWGDYLHILQYWWMGDALGIALFTPLVLAWLRGGAIEWTKEHVQRAVLVAVVLVTAGLLIFSDLENRLLELGLFFPILIWVALNFNLRFTSLALTLVFVGSIMGLLALGNLHGDKMDVLVDYVWLYNLLFGMTAMSVAVLNSRRDRVEQALRRSEETLKRAQAVGGVGSWHFDIRKKLLEWSGETYRIFGIDSDKPVNYEIFLQHVHPEDREMVDLAWRHAMKGMPYDVEHRIWADGKLKWVRERGEMTFDAHRRAVSGTGTVQDITEWKTAQEDIQRLAYYDVLTGLPNRTLLYDRLNQSVAAAHRDNDQFALMFLDLDRFKYINDTLGHQAGDEMLKVIAARLVGAVREGDTVSRLGGDEFVILLRETGAEGALYVAEKLLASVAQSFEVSGTVVSTEASVGISLYPHDGADVETLIKHADVAMYHAKAAGRNNFQFYTEQINERAMSHFNIERDLRIALEQRQLMVYYQPQIRMSDRKLIGFEALLRWNHPQNGMVPPAVFIPVAEESGLIVPVGEWVLREVCRQARAWHDQGLSLVPVAVNLSARQLNGDRLVRFMRTLLAETNLPEWTLELELTESMMLDDEKAAMQFIGEMRALGVALSIDDFGTGYSSLSHLKKLPLDKLKIDQSFVRDLAVDEDDAAIVRAIISMAHGLGLTVIAEGVENAQQMEFLEVLGCNEVQGYYYAKPMPASEAEAYISRLH
jgi:diguanylate cyclase (GGDEF)-like protein/PAS domain S-box-containing protein